LFRVDGKATWVRARMMARGSDMLLAVNAFAAKLSAAVSDAACCLMGCSVSGHAALRKMVL
jgi:hypothetical protein